MFMRRLYYVHANCGHYLEIDYFKTNCKWKIEMLEELDKRQQEPRLGGNIFRLKNGLIKHGYALKIIKNTGKFNTWSLIPDDIYNHMVKKGFVRGSVGNY